MVKLSIIASLSSLAFAGATKGNVIHQKSLAFLKITNSIRGGSDVYGSASSIEEIKAKANKKVREK